MKRYRTSAGRERGKAPLSLTSTIHLRPRRRGSVTLRYVIVQEYLAETAPDAARRLGHDVDPEELEEHRAYVKELHRSKLVFLASIGMKMIANQLDLSFEEFAERFAPGSEEERVRVNWSQVARDAQGPTRVGDRSRIASNGGQGWAQLLRASAQVELDLLCTREGERGFHRRRSANYRIQVGSRKISMAQKPTVAQIKDIFQKTWVETGLVNAGRRIEAHERRLVPDGEGGFKSMLKDVSGRHLTLAQHFTTHLQHARDNGYLLSMPPYLDESRMSTEHVEKRLEALGAPDRLLDPQTGKEVDESALAWRQRARIAELAARAGLPRFGASDFVPPVNLSYNKDCGHCYSRFCTECGVPHVIGHAEGSECKGIFEWACVTCFRAANRSMATVQRLLHLRGAEIEVDDLTPAEQHRALLAQLLQLHADDDCVVALQLHGAALRLPNESEYEREQRAATYQNRIPIWTWADDTPISRRTMQFHLWGVVHSHLTMVSTEAAAEFCRSPQLMVVMPGSATSSFLGDVMEHVVSDMEELGSMADDGELVLGDGTKLTWLLRFDKDDSPMAAHKAGKSSAGNAHQKCACCNANVFEYRDTPACLDCQPTSLKDVDAFARTAMSVDGFSKHLDVRAARVPQVTALLQKFGKPVGADELGAELEARAIALCDGVVGLPLLLGRHSYDELPAQVQCVQITYDYVLHGVKGLAESIRTEVKARLSKANTEAFTQLEQSVLGNKTYYTGADYRLWVAATPWMLESLGVVLPPRVEHLRQAAACLAQLSKWGYRANYSTWWNLQPRVIMRFTALAFRCGYESLHINSAHHYHHYHYW